MSYIPMAITIANMSCIDFKQVSKKLTLTFKINIINVEQSIKVTVIVSSFLTNDKHFSLIIYMPSLVSLTLAHDITYLDPFLGPQTGSLFITDYKMYFKVGGSVCGCFHVFVTMYCV